MEQFLGPSAQFFRFNTNDASLVVTPIEKKTCLLTKRNVITTTTSSKNFYIGRSDSSTGPTSASSSYRQISQNKSAISLRNGEACNMSRSGDSCRSPKTSAKSRPSDTLSRSKSTDAANKEKKIKYMPNTKYNGDDECDNLAEPDGIKLSEMSEFTGEL